MGRLRVAVTGAGGFVGRHVVEELIRRGHHVEAAVGERPAPEADSVNATRVDLLDPVAARRWIAAARADSLLHAAWYAAPGAYWTSKNNERWSQASCEIFSAALESGVNRIVGIGSCAEYLWDGRPSSEEHTPLRPATPYGRAKHQTATALEAIAGRHDARWAWARLFYLFGPYEPPSRLVPSVIRAVLEGRPAACSEGTQLRDFLYVGDAASAVVALLESRVQGPVNVASGKAIAVRELVERVITRAGGGRADFGALPNPSGEPPCVVADVTRLKTDVGWTPVTQLDDALDRAIAFEKKRTA